MGDAGNRLLVAEQIIVDQIVESARSSVYERVLFLGPYARRVSFASQQNRALNLLWALTMKREIKQAQFIAVVGGGVSGTTLAAALQALGHSVTLYESGQVLDRQINARHRYIHPTINRWPEDKIRETTMGPYFDWISDLCSNVLKGMKAEWVRIRDRIVVVAPAQVVSFHEPPGHHKVAVKTDPARSENRDRYDLVFVTSGFSEEGAGQVGLATYWTSDELDGMAGRTDKQFLISGAGDGGLIDALRVAHRSFDDGKLTIRLANELNDVRWEHLETITQAERAVASSGERLERAVDVGSADLESAYLAAARNLPPETKEWLDESLRLELIERVDLIAIERWPFSPMAAPIHKLLLAHAFDASVIRHIRGKVLSYDRDSIRYARLEEAGDEGEEVNALGVVVIRHGSSPNFAKFFKPEDGKAKQQLIDRQKRLSADADRPMWREGAAPLMQWPPAPPFRDAIKHRLPLADALVHRIVGLVGKLEADENYGFVFDNVTPEVLAKLPDELFGFPLGPAPETIARPAGSVHSPVDRQADAIRPGMPIVATLNGRAGPIVVDARGDLFLLTAAHVLWSPSGGFADCVIDELGRTIGKIENSRRDTPDVSDVAMIRLEHGIPLDPSYGQYPEFVTLADPKKLFASPVYLINRSGAEREGYVSASLAPVKYRHAGSDTQTLVPNAVRIRPMDAQTGFATSGDSGAPVVDGQGGLLGLVIAEDGEYTYVAPLLRYMRNCNLRLATGEDIEKFTNEANENGPSSLNTLTKEAIIQMAQFRRLDLSETPVELGPIFEEAE